MFGFATKSILPFACMLVTGCVSSSGEKGFAVNRAPSADAGSDLQLHLIATTDLHGYVQPQATEAGQRFGGVDLMSGYFRIARQADPETILLDSGDLFQGTIISNLTEGASVVRWMNFAGYTAAAIGNHDFDFGPGGGTDRVVKIGQDPLGALLARETQANFKFLSANICSIQEDPHICQDQQNFQNARFTQPYLIKLVHGVKVGIIGLTTPGTPSSTLPANVANLRFFSLAQTLERFVPEMKAEGADVIVVLAHEGGYCENGICPPTESIIKMIDQLTPSTRQAIAVVLAGHTHNNLNIVYNGVHLMINGSYGRSFGYLTLNIHDVGLPSLSVSVDAKGVDFCQQVFSDSHTCFKGTGTAVPATFLGQPVLPDSQALAILARDEKMADLQASQVIGRLVNPVSDVFGAPESSLGELMADALRICTETTCTHPDDIGFQNDHGIRVKFIPAGPVTYGQIYETAPFDDCYSQLQLTGRQVRDLLVALYKYNHGSFGQVSGIKITYSKSVSVSRSVTNMAGENKTFADPIVKIEHDDGTELDNDRVYKIAMVDFLASGGGGTEFVLKNLQPAAKIHMDRILRDVIHDYLRAYPAGLDYRQLGGGRLLQQP